MSHINSDCAPRKKKLKKLGRIGMPSTPNKASFGGISRSVGLFFSGFQDLCYCCQLLKKKGFEGVHGNFQKCNFFLLCVNIANC